MLIVTRLSDFPTCFHPICFQTGNQYMDFQLLYNSLVKVDADESDDHPRPRRHLGGLAGRDRVHVQAEPRREVA